jgi:hypothetical protein
MCFCVLKYIMYYEPMHFKNKNLHQQTAIKKEIYLLLRIPDVKGLTRDPCLALRASGRLRTPETIFASRLLF